MPTRPPSHPFASDDNYRWDTMYCRECQLPAWNRVHSTPPIHVIAVEYVNVNEEGEDYDRHSTVEAALLVQDRFPNDTIEVRRLTTVVSTGPEGSTTGAAPV